MNDNFLTSLEAPSFSLDLDGKEIKVRAGDPLDINIPMVGTPTPEVTWLKEHKPLHPHMSTTLESDDDHTRLLIPVSKRTDSGDYTIQAKNDHGQCEATVKVTVIGKQTVGTPGHNLYIKWQAYKGRQVNGATTFWTAKTHFPVQSVFQIAESNIFSSVPVTLKSQK